MSRIAIGFALAAALFSGLPAVAGAAPLSARDLFRIGSGGERLVHRRKPRRRPRSVGHVRPRLCDRLPRRRGAGRPALRAARARARIRRARLAALRDEQAACQRRRAAPRSKGFGAVEALDCRLNAADVAYRVYLRRASGDRSTSPKGWAGYDSALRLGLAQPRRRPASRGRGLDRHHRRRRSRRLRAGPGRHARSAAGAGRGLSPQQCRQAMPNPPNISPR